MVAVVGIIIDLVNAPDASVVCCATNEPSKRIEVKVSCVNPVPVTVTLEPGGPLAGDTVMLATTALACSTHIAAILAKRIETINRETYLFTSITQPRLSFPCIYSKLSKRKQSTV